MASPARALMLMMVALVTAGMGARALVPSLGDAMARRIEHLSAAFSAPAGPVELTSVAEQASAEEEEQPPADRPDAPRRADARARRPAAKAPSGGAIDIPADRVAHLTEKQLRSVTATDAVDGDGHALGARLHGVGALSLGLADGDVVTSIDGRPTPDVSTGTASAMRAWASGEAAAHATLLRDGRTFFVTLHIPRGSASSRPRAASRQSVSERR